MVYVGFALEQIALENHQKIRTNVPEVGYKYHQRIPDSLRTSVYEFLRECYRKDCSRKRYRAVNLEDVQESPRKQKLVS